MPSYKALCHYCWGYPVCQGFQHQITSCCSEMLACSPQRVQGVWAQREGKLLKKHQRPWETGAEIQGCGWSNQVPGQTFKRVGENGGGEGVESGPVAGLENTGKRHWCIRFRIRSFQNFYVKIRQGKIGDNSSLRKIKGRDTEDKAKSLSADWVVGLGPQDTKALLCRSCPKQKEVVWIPQLS